MKFYVKHSEKSKIQGPFTVEEINRRLSDGLLNSECFAISDLGEGVERIAKSRHKDWIKLTRIPDVVVDLPNTVHDADSSLVRWSPLTNTLFVMVSLGTIAWVCVLFYTVGLPGEGEAALVRLVPGMVLLWGIPFPLSFLILLTVRVLKRK